MDELKPKKIDVLEDVYVEHVGCGSTHTLCVTNEGFVYAWGSGGNGKLGINSVKILIDFRIDIYIYYKFL